MSKFSILVAHYNSGDLFEACYSSLLQQDYSNTEVIIVDDCSTDGSWEKVLALTAGNAAVTTSRNLNNHGVGFTKRKCVELASGEFCGFVDPDDALQKDALSVVMSTYAGNKKAVATYSRFYLCDEHLSIQKPFPNTRKVKTTSPYFFNILFQVSHFFTFRKEIYEKTEGIRADLKISEDMDLYLKLAEKGEFAFIDQELYLYRIHKKGLSHDTHKQTEKQKSWDDVLRVAAKRRHINKLGGRHIEEIKDLPKFLFERENTILKRIMRKL